ncbi:MAG: AAA family ATPase [Planctomycetes bacterium]|nr:AAA family ATPase [Planctomycetota bacterium]
MSAAPKQPEIHIWGPPILDWLNVSDVPKWPGDGSGNKLHLNFQYGGVFLLEKLLEEMNSKGNVKCVDIHPITKKFPRGNPNKKDKYAKEKRNATKSALHSPKDPHFGHTWSTWEQAEENNQNKFRLPVTGITSSENGRYVIQNPEIKGNEADRLLILNVLPDDKKSLAELMGFLGANNNCFEEVIVRVNSSRENGSTAIDPASDNINFLNEVKKEASEVTSKLTLLTKLHSLRDMGERIGDSISWEQMLDDVSSAVHRKYKYLCKRVIVTIGLCGAIIVDFNPDMPESHDLIYCVSRQENDDESELDGRVIGNSTCMLAALGTEWTLAKQHGCDMNVQEAVQKGVAMIRQLNKTGYVPGKQLLRQSKQQLPKQSLTFPIEQVRTSFFWFKPKKTELALFKRSVGTPSTSNANECWTILESAEGSKDPFNIAKKIITHGGENINEASQTSDFPLEEVHNWRSADRNEIELVRSVHNTLRNYLHPGRANHSEKYKNDSDNKPISIGIFGPPGSGKSFVVKEIAKKLKIDQSQLTINLSQMESPRELAQAFQRARNFFLEGTIPIVFWDEFDSAMGTQPLGWLRYFLSPMQDGEFLDQGIKHPIGKAIFVFAGGTTSSYEDFIKKKGKSAAAAKKPDFVSRLRGYIDVKGPNIAEKTPDKFYMVRRAFLIRALLGKYDSIFDNGKIQIDDGVVNAFLKIENYLHGARSIENIILLSNLEGRSRYSTSSLPPKNLLGIHVDVEKFMNHVNE